MKTTSLIFLCLFTSACGDKTSETGNPPAANDANSIAQGTAGIIGDTNSAVSILLASVGTSANATATLGGCTLTVTQGVSQLSGSCDGCKKQQAADGSRSLACTSIAGTSGATSTVGTPAASGTGSATQVSGMASISLTNGSSSSVGGCMVVVVNTTPKTSGSCDHCQLTADATQATLTCTQVSAGSPTTPPATTTPGGTSNTSSTISLTNGSTVTSGGCTMTISGNTPSLTGNCSGCSSSTDSAAMTATLSCAH